MVGLTAAEIAKLAFGGAIQASAGALSQAAIERAKILWRKIREKFQGNPIAEESLNDAESQRSPEILEQEVVPLLQVAMRKDPQFAQEIQVIAQQINQEINASAGNQTNLTSGDVGATDRSTAIGNVDFEASDSATGIGNVQVEGEIGKIGGTHKKKS